MQRSERSHTCYYALPLIELKTNTHKSLLDFACNESCSTPHSDEVSSWTYLLYIGGRDRGPRRSIASSFRLQSEAFRSVIRYNNMDLNSLTQSDSTQSRITFYLTCLQKGPNVGLKLVRRSEADHQDAKQLEPSQGRGTTPYETKREVHSDTALEYFHSQDRILCNLFHAHRIKLVPDVQRAEPELQKPPFLF